MAKPAKDMKRRSTFRPHDRYYAEVYGDSRTRQEFADECDINQIMRRFAKTGALTHFNRSTPRYLDLTVAPSDLQTALGMMQEAESAFARLPAVARREFDNDALKFVEFAENPENIERMREWGLAPMDAAKVGEAVKPFKMDEHTAQFTNKPASDKPAPKPTPTKSAPAPEE